MHTNQCEKLNRKFMIAKRKKKLIVFHLTTVRLQNERKKFEF